MLYDELAKKYPPEYMVGFYVTDLEVVNAYLTYLGIRAVQLSGVAVETNDQGTVVHARIGNSLEEINWAEPEKAPNTLPGYANTVYQFSGPEDVQRRRAKLLAEVAKARYEEESIPVSEIPVQEYSVLEKDFAVISILGIGLRLLMPEGTTAEDILTGSASAK